MIGIDKLAYKSRLAHVKAGTKLLFALTVMAICLFFNSILVSALTVLLMPAATLFMGGCRPVRYLRLLTVPLAFLITGTLTIMVSSVADPAAALISVRLFGSLYGISADTLTDGIHILLKAFGAVTCLYFFSLNTPMNAFLSLLRRKVPGLLASLMELIYRFIFVIWEEAGKIHTAQASRLGYDGFMHSMRSLGDLVTSVFFRAFRRVDRVNTALESRGFDGSFELLAEQEETSMPLTVLTVISAVGLIAVGSIERLLK
jgi:cobalt/nickel transport system permease protein